MQGTSLPSNGWPTAREYREAIVDPAALGDAELQEGTLVCSPGGTVRSYAGTFATTFHFETAGGGVALRCYTRGGRDIERRYAAIAELLRYVRNDALCQAQYVPEAIRVGDRWWPAVKMDWVAGRALNAEVEARLDDGDALLALADSFRETLRSLEVLGVAHGDLQHGNILVEEGRLRLIDYDATFLPAIAGLSQTEYGHRNYQHPDRRTAPFDSRIDRFSSIVIYTALVALSADRTLWPRFNDGENLLFRAQDFTSRGNSELFRELLAGNATSGLADVLRSACEMPVEQVPSLEEAIDSTAGTMPAPALSLPAHQPEDTMRNWAPLPAPALGAVPGGDASRSSRLGAVAFAAAVLAGIVAVAVRPHRFGERASIAHARHTAAVAVAKTRREPLLPVAVVPRAHALPATPSATATLVTTPPPATAPPTLQTPTRAPAPPTAASTITAASAAPTALQGAWQIVESNVQDGLMVWSGAAVAKSAGTLALNVQKDSVAGRSASRCERETSLHATLSAGVAQQTVPYQETNCEGATSVGEVRVDRFSPDARSFHGSFWQGGTKLGDFTATKQ